MSLASRHNFFLYFQLGFTASTVETFQVGTVILLVSFSPSLPVGTLHGVGPLLLLLVAGHEGLLGRRSGQVRVDQAAAVHGVMREVMREVVRILLVVVLLLRVEDEQSAARLDLGDREHQVGRRDGGRHLSTERFVRGSEVVIWGAGGGREGRGGERRGEDMV